MGRERAINKVYLVSVLVDIPGQEKPTAVMVYGKGKFLTDAILDASHQVEKQFSTRKVTYLGAFTKDTIRNIWVRVRPALFEFAVSVSQEPLLELEPLDEWKADVL